MIAGRDGLFASLMSADHFFQSYHILGEKATWVRAEVRGVFHFWGQPLRRLRTTLDMRQISVDRDALGLKSASKPSQGLACPRTDMHLR